MNTTGKLTPELQDCIVQNIENGNYISVAAQCAGINKSTHCRWMDKGRNDISRGEVTQYSEYFEAVTTARAKAEAQNVFVIKSATHDTWQAAAWWLERTFPDRWGRRDRMSMEHTGRNGGPIEVGLDLSKLSDKELDFLNRVMNKAAKEDPKPEGVEEE